MRTYVHRHGCDPGVWFLSLDAASSLGVQIGRQKWGLPYYRSAMTVRRRKSNLRYTCERQWPGKMGVGGTVEAEIGDVRTGFDCHVGPGRAVPGSLEHFLIERLHLYSLKKGHLLEGHVHHSPYPLREAQVQFCEESWLADVGLNIRRPPDHVLFSEGVSTEVFASVPSIRVRESRGQGPGGPMQTQPQMAPPKPPDGRKSLTGFPEDEMAELAGRIAALSKREGDFSVI